MSDVQERLDEVNRLLAPHKPLSQAETERWMKAIELEVTAKPVKRSSFLYIGIAAAVVICITYVHNLADTIRATPGLHVYETVPGQRASIQLPDGSKAVLAANTRLQYSADFGRGNRDVEVKGQALFTVVNGSTHPFTVKTGNLNVRVLGTTFLVRNYDVDTESRVVVAEGKVSVRDVVLASGDAFRISTTSGKVKIARNIDTGAELGWAQGRIILRDMTVREAFVELGRFYGVTFKSASPEVLDHRITSTLDNVSMQTAVVVLERLLGTHAEQNGNTITFKE